MIGRRTLMGGLGAAIPLAAGAQENYPTRPIAMMVGFAPGGGTDIVSRLLSPQLNEELGQPVTVENRPGASGTLAAGMVARARPDGYTLLTGTVSSQCTVAPLMRPPPYDQLRDFTPLMLVGTLPLVMVVRADSPARDVASLRAYAQEKPDGLNYGTSGVATQQHLASELLARQGRMKMTHVPYRGTGQSVNALMAGDVDVNIDTLATYLPHIRSGKLRALATTLPQRASALPDVPTVEEQGFPGYDMSVWYMVLGPAGLPDHVVRRLERALSGAIAHPLINRRLVEAGYIPGGGTAAEAAALVQREAQRLGRLVQEAGISLD
ncbi:Bug family tripartite tricarboxylate transporter substrate binding protein [Roseomonas xinghualingensis]|uniref:Bug family tripartite tricarboxylate transporter substrate binding protein n=1 Tax=Roseomonas xinghualingensis TaxID=2986475 RepID=UPI0021F0B061|nr:tripartite tricarboxylate transporter substrate binding protein [Roseomonas sp. SXEYE001]MCV4209566.1 tripartite tricarboxylate transporter substrate binding protein [Roseomonas sp. SXEYE001]